MKLRATFAGVVALLGSNVFHLVAADIEYAVVAFPAANQGVGVSVAGKLYPLKKNDQIPNLFSGTAPETDTYQYALTEGQKQIAEIYQRKLLKGTTKTGNEFFNRSRTIYDVPELPQAYHPVYPPLFSGMNRSNEIATIILNANQSALDAILKEPTEKHEYAKIFDMTYISNQEIYKFNTAGIKNSGQSSKDFAVQSYKIDFNEFKQKGAKKNLLFGRTAVKLRAQITDPTLTREKLMLDCLAASGAATLSGSWVRLIINGQPYGLFLMIDDSTTHLIENILYAGNWDYKFTGPIFKGNALGDGKEADLVYKGPAVSDYEKDVYKLEDKGKDKTLNKTNGLEPLIHFMDQLQYIDIAKDVQNTGNISSLIDPTHTLLHVAMNFLSGSWDGFWYQGSNYYLTKDLQTNKWTLVTYDFDEALGNYAPEGLATVSYQDYVPKGAKRPLVDVLLQSPYYRAQFEEILKTLIKRFFKPSVINPRLAAWTEMLKDDIAWTRSIPPKSPGEKMEWTLQDFLKNMNTTVQNGMGLAEWVKLRSESAAKQLNINDKDDLPPLGPYKGGRVLGVDGEKKEENNGNNQQGNPNGSNGQSQGEGQAKKDNSASTSSISLIGLGMSVILGASQLLL
ncbi:hypothetical protein EC973_008229 [Apophysomyces ossiformis]|uniref:Coth protein-domain-containing protein n=1 Tax=Apophysomyces ossiformis TaxID=679940 RepID=A0A8H7BSU1_9FUNG|nr:hypothetical protein EC973_008229 [Apophysomyces ossiformis]